MHKDLYVRVRCPREDYRVIRTPLVWMFDTPLGPLPDPQGCDVFVHSKPCKECRKYLISYLMYHEYKEDSVLDPLEPLPPRSEP